MNKTFAGAIAAGALALVGCEAGSAGGGAYDNGRSATSDHALDVDKKATGSPATVGAARKYDPERETREGLRWKGDDQVQQPEQNQGRASPRSPRAHPGGATDAGSNAVLPDAGGASQGGAGLNDTSEHTPAMSNVDGGVPRASGRPQGGDTDGGTPTSTGSGLDRGTPGTMPAAGGATRKQR